MNAELGLQFPGNERVHCVRVPRRQWRPHVIRYLAVPSTGIQMSRVMLSPKRAKGASLTCSLARTPS